MKIRCVVRVKRDAPDWIVIQHSLHTALAKNPLERNGRYKKIAKPYEPAKPVGMRPTPGEDNQHDEL